VWIGGNLVLLNVAGSDNAYVPCSGPAYSTLNEDLAYVQVCAVELPQVAAQQHANQHILIKEKGAIAYF
jgi:hypothetical protein